jgi:tight adherence protein B
MKDEFIRVMNEIALGVSPQDALHAVYRRTKVPEFSIFAVTIGVQTRSGGRLAETIQNLAATVRTRLGMAARAKALAGEARVSAFILGSMPFVAGGALSLIKPGYLDPLFNDPRGHTMLTIAGVGLVLGILTMRTLIGSATKE